MKKLYVPNMRLFPFKFRKPVTRGKLKNGDGNIVVLKACRMGQFDDLTNIRFVKPVCQAQLCYPDMFGGFHLKNDPGKGHLTF